MLLVGGALAYDAWEDIKNPDPRPLVAARANASESLTNDPAAQGASVSPTLLVTRGNSQVSEPAKLQIADDSLDLGPMSVSEERSVGMG